MHLSENTRIEHNLLSHFMSNIEAISLSLIDM